jgi:hypothetical protein
VGHREETLSPTKLLLAAESLEASAECIAAALQSKLSSMMSMPKDKIDVDKSLIDYCVDSLMAVEQRSWLAKTLSVDMSVLDIVQRVSILDFSTKVASSRPLVKAHIGSASKVR